MKRACIENSLKRILKGKIKITLALVIGFLINGTIGYGIDLDGTLTGGKVEIESGSYDKIYGIKAYNKDSSAVNNTEASNGRIIINNVKGNFIYGGYAENSNDASQSVKGDAKAVKNSIYISSINGEPKEIVGGYASSNVNYDCGNVYANENEVIIENKSTIKNKGYIIGGYVERPGGGSSKDSQANYNKVAITDSNVEARIYGAFVTNIGAGNPSLKYDGSEYVGNKKDAIVEAIGNKIIIIKTIVGNEADLNIKPEKKQKIYGSYVVSNNGGNTSKSTNNSIILIDSIIYRDIEGIEIRTISSSTGNSKSIGTDIVSFGEKNQVNISNSKVYGNVIGAKIFEQQNNIKARYGEEIEKKGIKVLERENQVLVKNNSDIKGGIYGTYIESKGDSNVANVSISKMSSIEILKNQVEIDNSKVIKEIDKETKSETIITGGYGFSNGGGKYKEAGDILLKKNSVIIKGKSEIFSNIYGAYGKSIGGYETKNKFKNFGDSGNIFADGNQVIIDGGVINGDIYGAYVGIDLITVSGVSGKKGKLTANNNIVTIKGSSNVENSNLYGSNLKNSETVENKLLIDGWAGKVNSINNFNTLEFQNINWKNNSIVLEIKNGKKALENTDINLISIKSGTKVKNGEAMYFVKSADILGTDKTKISIDKNFTVGLGLEGSGELVVEENGNILYKIENVDTSEQVNLIAENKAVSLAFINQGNDLVKQALDIMELNTNYGLKTFFATQGNKSKYDVDSKLKINSWSIIAGLGGTEKIFNKDFDWAIFYENGIGNYRTYNNFNQRSFNGNGELKYRGGGIASRYYYDDSISIDSSIRIGKLLTEMDNALMDINGNMYNFDFDTLYYGFHIGATKNIKISQSRNLDIYGKYLYTYTEDDDIRLDNQNFKFDSAKSSKVGVGFRMNEDRNKGINLYYGLGFEYEFDGKASMSVDGYSVPNQSLKGESYVGEFGVKYESQNSAWSYDIAVHGYIGKREGITGTLNITYKF